MPEEALKNHICSGAPSNLEGKFKACISGQNLMMELSLGDPERTTSWVHMLQNL